MSRKDVGSPVISRTNFPLKYHPQLNPRIAKSIPISAMPHSQQKSSSAPRLQCLYIRDQLQVGGNTESSPARTDQESPIYNGANAAENTSEIARAVQPHTDLLVAVQEAD